MNKIIFKVTVFMFIFFISFNTYSLCDDIDSDTIDIKKELLETSTPPEKEINPPSINSKASVIIDRNSNIILYGKNENEKRKMASTTKIMTSLIVIENCNLDDTIEISRKAALTGGSRLGLKTGDKITIKDLLYGLMMRSGNDCAVALAEYVGGDINGFANKMNKKSEELGLKNTHFETPHGLDSDEHYTTAYELALLSNYALNNKIFTKIVGTKNYTILINGQQKQLTNTNELLGNFDGIYGIKTGFTNGANRCLVTACKRNDIDVICVVLGADTKKFRTQDSIKLLNYVFDNFKSINIDNIISSEFENWKENNLNNIVLNKSISQNINLKVNPLYNNPINNKSPYIPIRKDFINSIHTTIDCPLYFETPIKSEEEIGHLNINISEYCNLCYSIVNIFEVKHKCWNNYFFDLLKNYFNILKEQI